MADNSLKERNKTLIENYEMEWTVLIGLAVPIYDPV
jgi:hypothetical protein